MKNTGKIVYAEDSDSYFSELENFKGKQIGVIGEVVEYLSLDFLCDDVLGEIMDVLHEKASRLLGEGSEKFLDGDVNKFLKNHLEKFIIEASIETGNPGCTWEGVKIIKDFEEINSEM